MGLYDLRDGGLYIMGEKGVCILCGWITVAYYKNVGEGQRIGGQAIAISERAKT